jgi:hypothetical protein
MSIVLLVANLMIVCVLILLIVKIETFITWRTNQVRYMGDKRKEFFRAANALMRDDRTPSAVLTQVKILASRIDNPSVPGRWIISATRGTLRKCVKFPPNKFIELMDLHKDMPFEVERAYSIVVRRMQSCVTLMSLVSGSFVRRYMLWDLVDEDNVPQDLESGKWREFDLKNSEIVIVGMSADGEPSTIPADATEEFAA